MKQQAIKATHTHHTHTLHTHTAHTHILVRIYTSEHMKLTVLYSVLQYSTTNTNDLMSNEVYSPIFTRQQLLFTVTMENHLRLRDLTPETETDSDRERELYTCTVVLMFSTGGKARANQCRVKSIIQGHNRSFVLDHEEMPPAACCLLPLPLQLQLLYTAFVSLSAVSVSSCCAFSFSVPFCTWHALAFRSTMMMLLLLLLPVQIFLLLCV
jgi:hypothetical protein